MNSSPVDTQKPKKRRRLVDELSERCISIGAITGSDEFKEREGKLHWPAVFAKKPHQVTITIHPTYAEFRCPGLDLHTFIPLGQTDQPLGGLRSWFRCPVCLTNRMSLFLYSLKGGGTLLKCRACLRLGYRSQYETDSSSPASILSGLQEIIDNHVRTLDASGLRQFREQIRELTT